MIKSILLNIALFSGFLPFLLMLIKRKEGLKHHPFFPFIVLTAFATLYELVATMIFKISTSYWFQIYPLLSFLTLFYFFKALVPPKSLSVLKFVFILFLIAYGVSFFYWINPKELLLAMAVNRTSITIFIFTGSILWFKNIFNDMSASNLWANENFYFVVALCIYYSSTLFLFLGSMFIAESKLYLGNFWIVNIVSTLVLRLAMSYGVLRISK